MKAIQKPKAEAGFELIETDKPIIGPDDVLIKVSTASICGTDLHITQWDQWSASRIKPPLVYGHEFCGIIDEIGENVENYNIGDYVSAEMHLPCRTCYQCMTGNFHICENCKIFGIDLNGCFAEFVKIPQWQLVKIPKSIPVEYGACLDSLGNAVHAVSKGNVSGKSVLITGCGPVGLFAIKVAKALGATRVFASDISPYRMEMAKKADADFVFDASQVTVSEEIKKETKGRGADVVLEMSGSPLAIKDAFKALRLAGTMVMFGICASSVEINLNEDIIFKEARVIGCNGREIFKTWYLMLELLESGKLDIDFIITHQFALKDFGQAIELLASGNSGKVILTP